MKVYDFTEPELAFYKEFANFTPEEEKLFNMRRKGMSLDECTKFMDCEYENVKKISRRVNNKMIKITNVEVMKEWINCVYWNRVIG